MWYKNVSTHFFRFVTNHAFDRRTDGPTNKQLSRRCMLYGMPGLPAR